MMDGVGDRGRDAAWPRLRRIFDADPAMRVGARTTATAATAVA
jgi:hypothetical protein